MKNVHIVTLICILFVSASGCIMFCDYQALPSGHYWPKSEKWTVLPETNQSHSADSPLDFRSVYVQKSSDDWCHIYRFWPSGRAMFKNMLYPPSLDNVDNLNGSFLGYYKIEGGRLVVETYGPAGSPANKGGYSRDVLEVNDAALIQLSGTFNGHSYRDFTKYEMSYRRYDKYPIDKMQSEPFW